MSIPGLKLLCSLQKSPEKSPYEDDVRRWKAGGKKDDVLERIPEGADHPRHLGEDPDPSGRSRKDSLQNDKPENIQDMSTIMGGGGNSMEGDATEIGSPLK